MHATIEMQLSARVGTIEKDIETLNSTVTSTVQELKALRTSVEELKPGLPADPWG